MSKKVWKEFEDNLLTHSAAHYLMTIHHLLEEHGYARVTDIARELNITRGSCSISLKPLKKRGLVVENDNKFLNLSDEVQRLAEIVEKNDGLLEALFRDVLGVDAEQAEIDACKIEHLLSIETSMQLANFIQFTRSSENAAKDFIKELGKRSVACPHDIEKCDVCQTVCFVDSRPASKQGRKKSAASSA